MAKLSLILAALMVLVERTHSFNYTQPSQLFDSRTFFEYLPPFYRAKREAIRNMNLAFIQHYNWKMTRGENPLTYTLRENNFIYYTHLEYIDTYLFPRYGSVDDQEYDEDPRELPISTLAPNADFTTSQLPSYLDMKLHLPLDQGGCGSCYIFASLAVLEYHLAKILNRSDIRLSVQYVIDCGLPFGLNGCYGGIDVQVFDFINKHGIVEEEHYPYKARDHICKLNSDPKLKSHLLFPKIRVLRQKNVANQDPNWLKYALNKYGPALSSFDGSPVEFFLYGQGILQPICSVVNNNINHLVTIMGYGHDLKTKKDFLVVQNSMGTSWGENGFFRMDLDDSNCFIKETWNFIQVTLQRPPDF